MDSKHWGSLWVSIAATVVMSGIFVVGGCTLDKNGSHPGSIFTRIGGHTDPLLEPKRCLLKVAILSRPFADPVVNEVVWRVADEQIILPAVRRAWEANGLRVGRIIGEMPGELEAILRETTPAKKVSPATFVLENGNPTLIRVSEPVELATLVMNRDNRVFAKDFHDAGAFLRATAQHDGTSGVLLRLVPEIQHGPIQRRFQAQPNAVRWPRKSSPSTADNKRRPSESWLRLWSSSQGRSPLSAAARTASVASAVSCLPRTRLTAINASRK